MGYKEINTNGATGEVTITDTRILSEEVPLLQTQLSNMYNNLILNAVPQYKQTNIALGIIVDPEKTQLLSTINSLRADYTTRLTALNGATDCDSAYLAVYGPLNT